MSLIEIIELEVRQATETAFQNAVNRIVQMLIAAAPVDTGELRDSITVVFTGDLGASIIAAGHGRFTDEGTAPHTIEPVDAAALMFEIAGRTIFAKSVNHPGIQATGWWTDTFEQFDSILDEELSRAGLT